MTRTNPTVSISAWQLAKRKACVFTQPSDADAPFSMVFIEWSPNLVRISNKAFDTPEEAKAYAAKVNTLGFIEDANWNKCAPNTDKRTNPLYPAHHVYDYTAQESA
jgi:hypothetical protein